MYSSETAWISRIKQYQYTADEKEMSIYGKCSLNEIKTSKPKFLDK